MTQSTKKTTPVESPFQDGTMYYNGQYSEVVTPLIVDLNDIFDDRITLTLSKFIKIDTKLAVRIGTSVNMHNVTGTIVSVKETERGCEAVLELDFIPDGLMKDLEEILAIISAPQEEGWE